MSITQSNPLAPLLAPRSIAVLGASDKAGNLGKTVIGHLQKFDFPGPIYPIHPANETVNGLKCYPSIAAVTGQCDMAVFAVSANSLIEAVQQCIDAGVKAGIALAGGFSESSAEGRERQAQLKKLCDAHGFVLCGPNCIGIINTAAPMAATFASALITTDALLAGNISIVSQSGGIATLAQTLAAEQGYGVRSVVSSGNEAVTTTAQYIEAFSQDPGTKVICVYIEGLIDSARFMAALAQARDAGQIVVLLKAGATPLSAVAALAHTGALSGEDRVWDSVLNEYGVIRVRSTEEMLDTALFLSGQTLDKLPKGTGLALVGFGGGGGVLGADQAANCGLAVARIDPERLARIRPLLPPIASVNNPFDLTPDTYNKAQWMEQFPSVLDEIAADDSVDFLLIQLGASAHKADELVTTIVNFKNRTSKTVAVSWTLAPLTAVAKLKAAGIHAFAEQARAIATLGRLATRGVHRPVLDRSAAASAPRFEWSSHVSHAQSGTVVSEHECHAILRAAQLPVARGVFCNDLSQIPGACAEIGYPVALKGISANITHRAAAGLVRLGVADNEQARRVAAEFQELAAQRGVVLEGIYAQEMIPAGVELIVGATRDPIFGIVISCGAGGVLTELLDDVAIGRAPLDHQAAKAMVLKLKIVQHALKNSPSLQIKPLVEFLVHFSAVAKDIPWVEFALEVNPIKWRSDGVCAVDGLLIISAP